MTWGVRSRSGGQPRGGRLAPGKWEGCWPAGLGHSVGLGVSRSSAVGTQGRVRNGGLQGSTSSVPVPVLTQTPPSLPARTGSSG